MGALSLGHGPLRGLPTPVGAHVRCVCVEWGGAWVGGGRGQQRWATSAALGRSQRPLLHKNTHTRAAQV